MIKLNVGSCDLPLPKPWINIDLSTSPHIISDLTLDGRLLDEHFSPNSVDEIYAGHFVEHLHIEEARAWFQMCHTILKPGGKLCFVTPDFEFIVTRYERGDPSFDIGELEETYLYSWKQESRHMSIWDQDRQMAELETAGFLEISTIDRMEDERLAYPAHWQCGAEGIK